jgi:type VI secretion system protein ImpG
LWPLELVEAEYLSNAAAVVNTGAPSLPGLKAGIRLRLKTTAGLKFNQLALDNLPLYLRGVGELPMQIYEQCLANTLAVAVQSTQRPVSWQQLIKQNPLRSVGFSEQEALLPYTPRSFQGYRLLQEYFAFPERFMFVELTQLQTAIRQCNEDQLDIIVLLNRYNPQLVNSIDASRFALFCTPAVNVFPKKVDRVHLSTQTTEYHIVADRTRPLDYEIYQVREVTGLAIPQKINRNFCRFIKPVRQLINNSGLIIRFCANRAYCHRGKNCTGHAPVMPEVNYTFH